MSEDNRDSCPGASQRQMDALGREVYWDHLDDWTQEDHRRAPSESATLVPRFREANY